jgi:hypothetical protein
MAAGSIQLTQSINCDLSNAERSLWPLSVKAVGTNMPSDIFVYQLVPVTDTLPGDRYQCVASAVNLTELPTVSHLPKKDETKDLKATLACPFYRTDTAIFNCHSLLEAQNLWQQIQDQVQGLVDNYNQWQSLQTQNVIVIS